MTEEDFYYMYRDLELERAYRKPHYNPFEIFKPSKALIKECFRDISNKHYEIVKKFREKKYQDFYNELKKEGLSETFFPLKQQEEKYSRLIKSYQWYLKGSPTRPGITDSDILRAKQRPINELYAGKLRKFGNRFQGPCPFHEEQTPSFIIYEKQNSWWCYGCSQGGSVIDYIMKRDNCKFLEAVKILSA